MPSRRTWRTAMRASSRVFMRDLDHFLAALLVEFGNADAQDLAFDRRAQAEIGVADRLVDGRHHALVPDLDRKGARFRHADRRDLDERRALAIGLDMDRLQQARGGAPGAQAAQFVLERLDRALHPALEVGKIENWLLRHGKNPSLVDRTRRAAPRSNQFARRPCGANAPVIA